MFKKNQKIDPPEYDPIRFRDLAIINIERELSIRLLTMMFYKYLHLIIGIYSYKAIIILIFLFTFYFNGDGRVLLLYGFQP